MYFIQSAEGNELTMPKNIRTHYPYLDEACIIASNIVHKFDGWRKSIKVLVKDCTDGKVCATYENIKR